MKARIPDTFPGIRLLFDVEENPYWDGKPFGPSNYQEFLEPENFAAVLGWQLTALAVKRSSKTPSGKLPDLEDMLAEFAGLDPVSRLLDKMVENQPPAEYFADAMAAMPERPKRPQPPNPVKARLANSVGEAIERARKQQGQMDYIVAMERWQRECADLDRNRENHEQRVAKGMERKRWANIIPEIDRARLEIKKQEIVLRRICVAGWEFLPPGPWLDYRESWLAWWFSECGGRAQRFDHRRIALMRSLNPIGVVHGSLGDSPGYVAYLFENRKAALENGLVGNALYFFHSDWALLSKYSKQELRRQEKAGDRRIAIFEHRDKTNQLDWLKDQLNS